MEGEGREDLYSHVAEERKEVDVAVIGNGPAGIALSLILSGHWPYFTGSHPNPYLTMKLMERPRASLMEQDLEYLSEDLEGRSNNPVSVLFDTLMRPNADIGQNHAPTLSWQHDPSKAISHVVVGSGRPGGAWHEMQPELETVSLGHWLELPGYPFNQWKIDHEEEGNQRSGSNETPVNGGRRKRALLGEVAQYYEDYVAKMGLETNFLNGVEVVCAMDTNKRSKSNSVVVKSQSSSSSSTSSSLSSSPSLDSPSHSAALNDDILSDVSPSDREDSEDSDPTLMSDDVFKVDDVQELKINEDSHLPGPHEISVNSAPMMASEDLEIHHEHELVPCPLQNFIAEPRSTSCFSDSSCCCVSDPDDCGVYCQEARKLKSEYKWCIRGKRVSKSSCGEIRDVDVKISAKKLVLACGIGRPRKLDVPGEHLPFVHHQYSTLGTSASGGSTSAEVDDRPSAIFDDKSLSSSDPILIIGAGLSAADAVLLALERGLKVFHAFYQDSDDSGLIFHKMPPDLYKEYRHVFALMQGKVKDDLYTPLPKHKVAEFEKEDRCRLVNDGGEEIVLDVSRCYVLIGSEGDLGFLPTRITAELGVHADSPIRPKTNPVSVDPVSFQSDLLPSLYAVGPLVGDNFVRFVLGGALGVAHHVVSANRSKDV